MLKECREREPGQRLGMVGLALLVVSMSGIGAAEGIVGVVGGGGGGVGLHVPQAVVRLPGLTLEPEKLLALLGLEASKLAQPLALLTLLELLRLLKPVMRGSWVLARRAQWRRSEGSTTGVFGRGSGW